MPPKTAHSSPRPRDFSRLQILLMFVVLCAVISIPVLTHQLPPLSDYVNHLARMQVIDTVDTDPYLARFYEIHWQIIPNLIMDFVVPPLARVMNIYLAGQFFLLTIFVLNISGALVLNRALSGRWSALPLVAAPLVYNNMLLVGTANYLFGIGLVLWALAGWIALRERHWPYRYAASAAFVIALFFCHLVAAALYALGLFAYEVTRLWKNRATITRATIFEFCSAGIPFLPVIPLLLASPTWGLASENVWEQRGKVDGLMFVFNVYSDFVAFTIIAIGVAALVWAVRHRLVQFQPMGWILLVLGGAIYLAMPRMLFAVYMADQRLPIGLAFMLIACLDVRLRPAYVRYGFAGVLVAIVALRVGEVQIAWNKLSKSVESVRESVEYIDRGSQVLVAYADPAGGDDVTGMGLTHAACLAMIERSALVTTAFTVPGKQILRVREEYADRADTQDGTPPTMERLVLNEANPQVQNVQYWNDWQDHYDYVYVLFTEQGAENPDPVHLRLAYEGYRFQLYRMANPHTTTAASASAERLRKKISEGLN